jgi:hypothetical protein
MQVSLFKGLCVVNLHDSLFVDPAAVRFARGRVDRGPSVGTVAVQAIDFTSVGGPVIIAGVDHYSGGSCAAWAQEDTEKVSSDWDWGTTRDHMIHICGRSEVAAFGQSSKVEDLTHLIAQAAALS